MGEQDRGEAEAAAATDTLPETTTSLVPYQTYDIPLKPFYNQCKEQVEQYKDRYGRPVPVTFSGVKTVQDWAIIASREDVDTYRDELAAFYDDLLQVDTAPVRDEFADNTIYDPTLRDTLSRLSRTEIRNGSVAGAGLSIMAYTMSNILLGEAGSPEHLAVAAGVGAAAGLAWPWLLYQTTEIEGRYFRSRGWIGISDDTLPQQEAYSTVGAELFHAYQYTFDSPTLTHFLLHEGAERGTKIRGMKHKADRESHRGWQQAYDAERTNVMVNAYATLCDLADEDTDLLLTGIGLSHTRRETVQNNLDNSDHAAYNLGAAAIQQAETMHGDGIYRDVFHGDYTHLPDWFTQLTNPANT